MWRMGMRHALVGGGVVRQISYLRDRPVAKNHEAAREREAAKSLKYLKPVQLGRVRAVEEPQVRGPRLEVDLRVVLGAEVPPVREEERGVEGHDAQRIDEDHDHRVDEDKVVGLGGRCDRVVDGHEGRLQTKRLWARVAEVVVYDERVEDLVGGSGVRG